MHNIRIIEDCDPFYVRFTIDGMEQVIDLALNAVSDVEFSRSFTHHKLSMDDVIKIKEHCPLYKHFPLSMQRVSMFVSQPGLFYRAHKDGLNHKFGFNYAVKVLDDQCITSWFSDNELKEYPIDNLRTNNSRECQGFKADSHTPLKTLIVNANECVLFNTDIFHSWDNRSSTNERMMLTFRLIDYSGPDTDFSSARKRLLEIAEM